MNCYRCGFDFTDNQCPVCGKFAPTEKDPVGVDSEELRIAVLVPSVPQAADVARDVLAAKARHYGIYERGSERTSVYVYTPLEAAALFEVLQVTENVPDREILFNGRRRPLDLDLWLPLLWYLTP